MPAIRILGPNGQPLRDGPAPAARPDARAIRARYDAAASTADNAKLWADADALSARAANSPQVRRVLRNRARYERVNNSYLEGIVQTLANDTIGTGPRIQLLTDDDAFNRQIERAFAFWADAVKLAAKLRTMRMSRVVDGEAFALLITNAKLPTAVKLDLKLIEAEQVATPYPWPLDPHGTDGLTFDDAGNVIEYHLLNAHPGDLIYWGFPNDFTRIPAEDMIHWFRADRPGQYRGVPEITSAIADFSELRRYSKAVLSAAETAADFAAILYSDMPPDGEAADAEPFENVEITKRMMTTVPAGWKLSQFKAEQPTTTYPDYERQNVNRFTRCLNMPRNIALGDSSGYNYSSGRLDHQIYYRTIGIDQDQCRLTVIDRVFAAWLTEYLMDAGLARQSEVRMEDYPHQWFFDGPEHVDPEKEANAAVTRINAGLSNLSIECAREGRDYEMVRRQRAREIALDKELGLDSTLTPQPATPEPQPGDGNADQTASGGRANGNAVHDFAHRNGHARP